MLNDRTPNDLTDTEFADIYDRMRLRVHCTLRSSDRTVVMVYKSGISAPIGCIEFGVGHSLETVKVAGKDPVPINDFLVRTTRR